MELDPSLPPCYIRNRNLYESNEIQANVEWVKTEIPEVHDVQLQLLQDDVPTIKLEKQSTGDEFLSLNTLEAEVTSNPSLNLKLEKLAQECEIQGIKQELLHEELDIKSEDERIQKPCVDAAYNQGNQSYTTILNRGKLFKCNICNYGCGFKYDLKKHLKTHSGEKPFSCNICNYCCGRSNDLKRHLKTHCGERPFKCNFCDYSFKDNQILKRHLRNHTGEKPFKCNICDHCFRRNDYLKDHLRTHTRDKSNLYDNSYKDNQGLKSHLITEEKPFKCKICDCGCTTNAHLQRHLRTHSSEKPFKCLVCNSTFAQKSYLKDHLSIHTEEKPFRCSICDYSCRKDSRLKRHLRTHTEEKPFKCNICDNSFKDKSNLNNHIRTHTEDNSNAVFS